MRADTCCCLSKNNLATIALAPISSSLFRPGNSDIYPQPTCLGVKWDQLGSVMYKHTPSAITDAAIFIIGSLVCSLSWADQDPNNHASRQLLPTDCCEIHSLGTLGGPFSSARDINDASQVTGNAATELRILDPADPALHIFALLH
jgi:hypothetical protein